MVLIRVLAPLLVLAACNRSLFSNGDGNADGGNINGDGNSGGDGQVSATCPSPCIADAGADFNGGQGGSNEHWRYLDDRRNRSWAAMTASGGVFTGADGSSITSCANKASAAGCAALPGALLLTSAGKTSGADPAIEFQMPDAPNQVVQLTLRVHAPTSQLVRLYRSAREDVLFEGIALAGTTLERTFTVDALGGDRILFALTPEAGGASDVAVQLFVSETGVTFPQHCQMALSFENAMVNNVLDACGAAATYYNFETGTETAPSLVPSAIPELGTALDVPPNRYLVGGGVLARPGDFTVQMWLQSDAINSVDAYGNWVFSDYDFIAGGGLGFVVYDMTNVIAEIGTCTDPDATPLEFAGDSASYPKDHAWHFVRIAYTGGMAKLCVDGAKLAEFAAPAGSMQSTYKPHIGRNVTWTPEVAEMDGKVDDVRVFDVALPCD